MKTIDEFSADMSKLFSLVKDICGGTTIQSTIFNCLDCDLDVSAENCEDWKMTFTKSENGMFYVLYDLVNYDLISLQGKIINIDASNEQEIASIISKYASEDNIAKVYNRFYE